MKTILISSLALAITAGAATAASFTLYNDRSTYETAVSAMVTGPTFFLDFNDPNGDNYPGVDGDFPDQVNFNTIGATNPALVNINNYIGDTGDPSTVNNVGILEGVLYRDTIAMGFKILSGSIEGAELYDSSGTSLGQALQFTSFDFIGIISDTAFTRFNLLPNIFGPSTSVAGGYDRVFIDDFTATASPVPLPASVLLLGAAVGGLGFVRRRQS
ncbi:VPLPA-CTERM sorting domain-containing protein [Pseudooceanicola onchidii]|uniref:VPLPA-CTERM sorting domain-containing protein n=1 Tax=Pseudooceanicola onchidii TaxID=2562279 RepID=UPI00145B090A|nr:VPLPA-CTERM sorting domain-containing protein [Pseudooceanicola onchidii]